MIDRATREKITANIARLERDVSRLELGEYAATVDPLELYVKDEGSLLGDIERINFAGPGVVATLADEVATVTVAGSTGGWALIEAKTLDSPAAVITFSGIPTTFKNLKFFFDLRASTNGSAEADWVVGYFNNDETEANYKSFKLIHPSDGGLRPCENDLGGFAVANIPANQASSDHFGAGWLIVSKYTQNDHYSGALSHYAALATLVTGKHYIGQCMGNWEVKETINRVDFKLEGAGNFLAGCRIDLYGLA